MKTPKDLREKQIKASIDKIHKQNQNFKEQMKVYSKQLEFMQDQTARTAIEVQAIQHTMSFILEKSTGIIKQEAERTAQQAGVG